MRIALTAFVSLGAWLELRQAWMGSAEDGVRRRPRGQR
jgi:hypothetical protein